MIAIIDYGLGNLTSVLNAFEIMNIPAKITSDLEEIKNSEKIILPGVGSFGEGINNLKEMGLIEVLNDQVLVKKKPFLGICLGMQLICKKSYENGEFAGLGWIDAEVVKFDFDNNSNNNENNNGNNDDNNNYSNNEKLKVPHIGWNDVKCNLNSPIFKDGNETQTFYFVHSYYVKPNNNGNNGNSSNEVIRGICNYGFDFCAVLQKDNIFATQFHPEKSQHEGLSILRKFALI